MRHAWGGGAAVAVLIAAGGLSAAQMNSIAESIRLSIGSLTLCD